MITADSLEFYCRLATLATVNGPQCDCGIMTLQKFNQVVQVGKLGNQDKKWFPLWLKRTRVTEFR